MYTISTASCKGGVSKSTTILNLADQLLIRGYKVLVIDTDPQRNTTDSYRAKTIGVATLDDILVSGLDASKCIQHTEIGDIIASDKLLVNIDSRVKDGPLKFNLLKRSLQTISSLYDYCLIDTPPALNLLTGNALIASDAVICPAVCARYAAQGLLDFYEYYQQFREVNPKLHILGILCSRYDSRENLQKEVANEILPEIAERMGTIVFHTRIEKGTVVEQAQAKKVRLSEYAKYSTPALNFSVFTDELLKILAEETLSDNK